MASTFFFILLYLMGMLSVSVTVTETERIVQEAKIER